MLCRRAAFALVLCTAMFSRIGWAQGGLVSAATSVRYTPVAFSQLVQLTDFNTVVISLGGSDANGDILTFALVTGPSLGSVGNLDSAAGTIAYTPAAGFSTSDSFTFLVTDGVLSSETATVTVFAPQPAANLSASSLDLGSQIDGMKSLTKAVTISNPSRASLNISAIAFTGPNAADFGIESSGTCPASGALPAGASCTLAISITPTSTGTRAARLAITDNAFDSPQTVAVTGAGTDFSFAPTVGASTSATVAAGQAATYNLQINSAGFAGQVSLSCSGAPQLASCTVSPSQVNVSGTATPFTVRVSTTAPTAALVTMSPMAGVPRYMVQVGLLTLAMLSLLYLVRPGERTRRAMFSTVVLGLAWFMIGCGGGNRSPLPTGQPGTPAGTYTLTVTGATGGATRSTPLTLIVH